MELLIYLCKSAAILAMFYIVYIAVLRKDTFFSANRHYLMSGILAAIILPLIQFTKRVYIEVPASNSLNISESLSAANIMIPEETISFNWLQIVLLIYSIGAMVILFHFLKQLYTLFRLLTKYPNEKRDRYTYIQTPQNCAPFSFFKYIVYNPELHSEEELIMILKHEEVHGSQWHTIDILFANLLLIFQWVNPLAWFYKKSIEENLEFIADNETVQHVQSVKQYQLALVKASSTIPIPALTTNFYQSFIKKRILMLNKSTSNKINAWKLSIILPLLAVFLWSFNVNEVIEYTEIPNEVVSTFADSFSASEAIKETPVKGENEDSLERALEKTANTVLPKTEKDNAILKVTNANEFPSEEKNTFQDVLLTITKNTTKSELEALKSDLKSKGFGFNYSNLKYNDSKEIIGISITYKDKNGNSGNYSVNSDSPINTIVIKASGNRISMRSAGSGDYTFSSDEEEEVVGARAKERREHMKEREMEMEERRAEMDERRAKMHEEMEEMRKEMEERSVQIRSEKDSTLFRSHGTRDNNGLFETRRMRRDSVRASILDRHGEREDRMRARNHSSIPMENLKRITKDASENDLDRLKSQFENEGVSFSYSSIKRNELGEIIKIKVKLDNNNGSISSSSYNNNGKPIKTILLGSENGTTVMTSSPN
jgi:beta-lactamase regulating signal transducer with metallopeptidase domain